MSSFQVRLFLKGTPKVCREMSRWWSKAKPPVHNAKNEPHAEGVRGKPSPSSKVAGSGFVIIAFPDKKLMRRKTDRSVINEVRALLEIHGELYVEVYQPHSGAGWDSFIINDIKHFIDLVSGSKNKSEFNIYRKKAFPVRGFIDEHFIETLKVVFKDISELGVIEPFFYPEPFDNLASGMTKAEEIESELVQYKGTYAWAGIYPPTNSTAEATSDEDCLYCLKVEPLNLV